MRVCFVEATPVQVISAVLIGALACFNLWVSWHLLRYSFKERDPISRASPAVRFLGGLFAGACGLFMLVLVLYYLVVRPVCGPAGIS